MSRGCLCPWPRFQAWVTIAWKKWLSYITVPIGTEYYRSRDLKHRGDKSLDLSLFLTKNPIFQHSIFNISGFLKFKFINFCKVHLPLHLFPEVFFDNLLRDLQNLFLLLHWGQQLTPSLSLKCHGAKHGVYRALWYYSITLWRHVDFENSPSLHQLLILMWSTSVVVCVLDLHFTHEWPCG